MTAQLWQLTVTRTCGHEQDLGTAPDITDDHPGLPERGNAYYFKADTCPTCRRKRRIASRNWKRIADMEIGKEEHD